MTEPIKKFVLKIWNEVENHLAKFIAGFIIIAFLEVLRTDYSRARSLQRYICIARDNLH